MNLMCGLTVKIKQLENNYNTSFSTIQHHVDNRINETMVYQNKSMMYLELRLEQLQHIQKNQSNTLDELATKPSESETRYKLTHLRLQKQIDDRTKKGKYEIFTKYNKFTSVYRLPCPPDLLCQLFNDVY